MGSLQDDPNETQGGLLLRNLMHFARVLRAGGLPIGPGRVVAAVEALQAIDVARGEDFYWALHSVFVNRIADRRLFDQAFHVFWREPGLLARVRRLALPVFEGESASSQEQSAGLDQAALAAGSPQSSPESASGHFREGESDAAFTWSSREVLRQKDFEQMSAEETARAKAALAAMRLPLPTVSTRRLRKDPRGHRIDMRASLRATLRAGQAGIPLLRARRRTRPASLVIICDISGSMSRYSRMLLHFAHTLTTDRDRVCSFVFGTRLTNVTRHLRERDVDAALEHMARDVRDWSGGTRIGHCLRDFNRIWSRRVLGWGSLVLLISDGLDRDTGQGLALEMQRLRKSCRWLIWLNPLLRYPGFEPRARGMQAMLPFVHELRTVHNLDSLRALSEALCGLPAEGGETRWPVKGS